MPRRHDTYWGWLLAVGLSLLPCLSPAQENLEHVLEQVDRVRTPAGALAMQVTITTQEPDKAAKVHRYEVLIQGPRQTLVRFLDPPSERGKSLLMLDQELWAYLPTVGKPIRITLAQRLVGDVANGDLARLHFAGDYTAALEGTEMVAGEESLILRLNAKSRSLTYGSIRLWVARATHHPLKAEFFTVSGQLLKSGRYQGYALVAGRLRPTRLVLMDHVHRGSTSTLAYEDMESRDIPEKFFNKNYMKQLE